MTAKWEAPKTRPRERAQVTSKTRAAAPEKKNRRNTSELINARLLRSQYMATNYQRLANEVNAGGTGGNRRELPALFLACNTGTLYDFRKDLWQGGDSA